MSKFFRSGFQKSIRKTSLSNVQLYNWTNHHIIPGFQATSIDEVASNLIGLHSARIPTPFVILHTRLDDFKTTDLVNDLFLSFRLIKLRCMRKTIHIVPLDIAPIVHQATLQLRRSDCLRFYQNLNISDIDVKRLKDRIVSLIVDNPISSEQILHLVENVSVDFMKSSNNVGIWKKTVRMIIKDLWEEGVICYINVSDRWNSEMRVYGYTKDVYPHLDLNCISVREAHISLIRKYISSYGPVTEEDICWWSGLSKSIVRSCVQALADILGLIEIDEMNKTFYMMKSDIEKVMSVAERPDQWISFLAYEDSSLKGYFESHSRYIHPQHYNALFNRIGEANASIMLNGEIIGLWKWDKKEQRVDWRTFDAIDTTLIDMVQGLALKLEHCLKDSGTVSVLSTDTD